MQENRTPEIAPANPAPVSALTAFQLGIAAERARVTNLLSSYLHEKQGKLQAVRASAALDCINLVNAANAKA